MKSIGTFLILLFTTTAVIGQNLSPYIMAFETSKGIEEVKGNLKQQLIAQDIDIAGEYMPVEDIGRWVICVSSEDLVSAVQKVGGLTGFAAVLRIALTRENDKTIVSYTNPPYWGNAYFRDDFDAVASYYDNFSNKMKAAMKSSGDFVGTPFGSKKGKSVKDLRNYRYKFMMPHFDDTKKLETFNTYDEAVSKVASSVKQGVPDLTKVYSVTIPGKNLTLYGFGLSGKDGESKFMPKIDIGEPKHTAFLPYEILVMENEVHMLHGRFRIALSFPDLSMGTFTKIMSTPGNIEDLMKRTVKTQ